VAGGFLVSISLAPDERPSATIQTGVSLVELHVSVTGAAGRTIQGLGKSAFELFVDGVKHPITVFQGEDVPVTAGIVIDNSASMAPKRGDVVSAALDFARASNLRDEMFVIHFSDRPRFGLPEGTPFTSDTSDLERAISRFHPGGVTALFDALMLAFTRLRGAMYSGKVVLLISDGGDNASSRTLDDVLTAARTEGTAIFAIGIFDAGDRDRNPHVLTQLAEATGGESFFPTSSVEVPGICNRIAADIRRQYTLGFAGAHDGLYHSITVTALDPRYGKLTVRTRAGYFALKQ
jgi:Ca-activated chloride channel homolog